MAGAPRSEQPFDQPLIVQPDRFRGGNARQAGHGHDLPADRHDEPGTGGKPATLETGAVVRVPLFVGNEELIKVDTRSGEYVGRVK